VKNACQNLPENPIDDIVYLEDVIFKCSTEVDYYPELRVLLTDLTNGRVMIEEICVKHV
jgi:hypothetical protein